MARARGARRYPRLEQAWRRDLAGWVLLRVRVAGAAVVGSLAWAGASAAGLAVAGLVQHRRGRSRERGASPAASLAAAARGSGVATPGAALGVLPALVVVLVPLHVALIGLVGLRARADIASRADAAESRLPA